MSISRREFIAAGAAPALLTAAVSRRPNFILIVADDLGCHDLGCLGAADLKTPHIDALAASGARFVNWYSNAPVCAPARSSILTGRYPIHAGVPGNGRELTQAQKTIATLLKPQGYATAAIGKWHLGDTPQSDPNAHGFDYYYGFHSGCVDFYSHRFYWGKDVVNYHDLWRNRTEVFDDGQYLTERIAAEAKQFIAQHKANPFFMYVAFNAPHYPMHAPREYIERFATLPPERRTYAAMIAAVDDAVGQVVRTLREQHRLEDTLIFVTADNGASREPRAGLDQKPATAGNNAPFRGNKFSAFDGGMHVPMIQHWPGVIPKAKVVSQVGSHLDILPTICKAAGVALPADRTYDGADSLPLSVLGAPSPHQALFWSQYGQTAVRRGSWKLVKNGRDYEGTPAGNQPLTGEDAVFLSNLDEDPEESRNLRRRYPQVVDELDTLLARWLQDVKQ
jgi:arylsulfatase A-like enzyme